MSLKVNIISKLSELKAYKKEWDNLFFSFGKSPFQSFEFIYYSWLNEFLHLRDNKISVVIIKRRRSVVAIFPLYIDGYKRLRFINDQHSDYCDFIYSSTIKISEITLNFFNLLDIKSIHFVNTPKDFIYSSITSNFKNLYNYSLNHMNYSEMSLNKSAFPEKIAKYKSKEKTEIRRIKKNNIDNDFCLYSNDNFVFPLKEIHELRNEMISLNIRSENFLKKERLMLLESLYNSGRLIISVIKNQNKIQALSFILKKSNQYTFWIDMYNYSSKMLNLYNYICFMEHIQKFNNVKISFGRGLYDYKIKNFLPDRKKLFAFYTYKGYLNFLLFRIIFQLKTFMKSVYKIMFR